MRRVPGPRWTQQCWFDSDQNPCQTGPNRVLHGFYPVKNCHISTELPWTTAGSEKLEPPTIADISMPTTIPEKKSHEGLSADNYRHQKKGEASLWPTMNLYSTALEDPRAKGPKFIWPGMICVSISCENWMPSAGIKLMYCGVNLVYGGILSK